VKGRDVTAQHTSGLSRIGDTSLEQDKSIAPRFLAGSRSLLTNVNVQPGGPPLSFLLVD
jgi:hypothetical protein